MLASMLQQNVDTIILQIVSDIASFVKSSGITYFPMNTEGKHVILVEWLKR